MNAMTLSWFAAFFHFSLSFYSINKKCFYFRNMTCRLRNMFPFNTIFLLVWYSHISFYMRIIDSIIYFLSAVEGKDKCYLPFLSLKTLKESECWCPKYCPTIISEYLRTNSRYLRLYFSCNQCWPRWTGLFIRLLPLGNSLADDLSYFPGGLWPKRIT